MQTLLESVRCEWRDNRNARHSPSIRTIQVGPVISRGGFQYWYLACFPDSIIALRQSTGAFFMLGLCDGTSHRQHAEFAIRTTFAASLCTKPNVAYEVGKCEVSLITRKKAHP